MAFISDDEVKDRTAGVRRAVLTGDLSAPPEDLHPTGDGDFFEIGLEFLDYFVTLGKLTPRSKVLEIGSGVGRMALPIAHFLGSGGSYVGMDISRGGVAWASDHITGRFPNVRFVFSDILHPMYNPSGTIRVDRTFHLPVREQDFDLVILTSVFTHLTRFEVKKYLTECRNRLKPGGTLFATFFLAPETPGAGFGSHDARFHFSDQGVPNTYYSKEGHPLSAVAYEQAFILDLLKALKFDDEVVVHRGTWHAGRSALGNFQDIVIATLGGPRAASDAEPD